jgi:hypothetical protein
VTVAVCLGMSVLWTVTIVQDLIRREISAVFLAGLAVLSLLERAWPWWALAGLMLLWPLRWRRQALMLAPVAVTAGLATGEQAPALALAAGSVAWALSWWGGADGIALLALAFRHGMAGLVAGALAAVLVGLALMMVRRRPLRGLLAAVPDALVMGQVKGEIPPEAEMPAAAALGVAGLVMEVIELWQMFG